MKPPDNLPRSCRLLGRRRPHFKLELEVPACPLPWQCFFAASPSESSGLAASGTGGATAAGEMVHLEISGLMMLVKRNRNKMKEAKPKPWQRPCRRSGQHLHATKQNQHVRKLSSSQSGPLPVRPWPAQLLDHLMQCKRFRLCRKHQTCSSSQRPRPAC